MSRKPFKNPFINNGELQHEILSVFRANNHANILSNSSGISSPNNRDNSNKFQYVNSITTPTSSAGNNSQNSNKNDFTLTARNNTDSTSSSQNDDNEKEEDEDNGDDDESENGNVFSNILRNIKDKDWSGNNNSTNQTLTTSCDSGTMASRVIQPHIHHYQMNSNYISMLDMCDKNMSMNTKALAAKYLSNTRHQHQNNGGSSSNSNDLSNLAGINLSGNTLASLNSYSNVIGCGENSIFAYGDSVNQTVFKIFPSQDVSVININELSTMVSMAALNRNSMAEYPSLPQIQDNQVLAEPASMPTNKKNGEESSTGSSEDEETEEDNENNKDDDETGSSESFNNNNQYRSFQNNKPLNEIEDEDDIWLFAKPNLKNVKKLEDGGGMFGQQLIKKKNEKNGRARKSKDFSDQDEDSDRDVTTVLDINKLKQLPKLL